MPNNPYQLTTEDQLTEDFNPQIETFWAKQARSDSFQGIDNKRIHTVSIKTGNDNAIVISQGRNESVLKYKELAYDLNKQGYDLYLIDHRGQGFSERLGGDQHRGHVDKFDHYPADLNIYINSLGLSENYQNSYLLAHSMGGAISALYLQQYKHPFDAAILFSPMLSINLGSVPTSIAKALTATSGHVCSWFSDQACYVFGGSEYKRKTFANNDLTSSEVRFEASQKTFEQYPTTQLGDGSMHWVSQSISATQQAVDNAEKITIPILLVQAGSDSVVTAEGQNEFYKNLKQCSSHQFLNISNAKHEILLESDQYRVPALNTTLQFLENSQQGKLKCTK
ncbi:MAG: alpha/beta fold hydrolase [Psychromonas sp.]